MNNEELSDLINEDLKIDFSSIETEWGKQALIYYKWSKMLIEARHESNEAKAKLIYVEAVLSNDVRIDYEKYNLKSQPTETAIKNIIIQNEGYIKARINQVALTVKTELLNAAVKSLEYKKNALEYFNQKTESGNP